MKKGWTLVDTVAYLIPQPVLRVGLWLHACTGHHRAWPGLNAVIQLAALASIPVVVKFAAALTNPVVFSIPVVSDGDFAVGFGI